MKVLAITSCKQFTRIHITHQSLIYFLFVIYVLTYFTCQNLYIFGTNKIRDKYFIKVPSHAALSLPELTFHTCAQFSRFYYISCLDSESFRLQHIQYSLSLSQVHWFPSIRNEFYWQINQLLIFMCYVSDLFLKIIFK